MRRSVGGDTCPEVTRKKQDRAATERERKERSGAGRGRGRSRGRIYKLGRRPTAPRLHTAHDKHQHDPSLTASGARPVSPLTKIERALCGAAHLSPARRQCRRRLTRTPRPRRAGERPRGRHGTWTRLGRAAHVSVRRSAVTVATVPVTPVPSSVHNTTRYVQSHTPRRPTLRQRRYVVARSLRSSKTYRRR